MSQIADSSFFEQISNAFESLDPESHTKVREAAHVRCLQLLFHAIARGAFAESLELVTDDFILEIFGPEDSPFTGRWEGRDEVLSAMERNFSMVHDQRPQVESLVAQGDQMIMTARETGIVQATGKPYDVRWVQEYTFADGKMKSMREFVDSSADFGPMA